MVQSVEAIDDKQDNNRNAPELSSIAFLVEVI